MFNQEETLISEH